MLAHGFTTEMLTLLVRDGLATATPETVHAGKRPIEVVRVQITDAGGWHWPDDGRWACQLRQDAQHADSTPMGAGLPACARCARWRQVSLGVGAVVATKDSRNRPRTGRASLAHAFSRRRERTSSAPYVAGVAPPRFVLASASRDGQNGNPSRTGRHGWGPVTGPFRRGSVTEVPRIKGHGYTAGQWLHGRGSAITSWT
jgi:hypothetical protein